MLIVSFFLYCTPMESVNRLGGTVNSSKSHDSWLQIRWVTVN